MKYQFIINEQDWFANVSYSLYRTEDGRFAVNIEAEDLEEAAEIFGLGYDAVKEIAE